MKNLPSNRASRFRRARSNTSRDRSCNPLIWAFCSFERPLKISDLSVCAPIGLTPDRSSHWAGHSLHIHGPAPIPREFLAAIDLIYFRRPGGLYRDCSNKRKPSKGLPCRRLLADSLWLRFAPRLQRALRLPRSRRLNAESLTELVLHGYCSLVAHGKFCARLMLAKIGRGMR
jgi:hypothetical protein